MEHITQLKEELDDEIVYALDEASLFGSLSSLLFVLALSCSVASAVVGIFFDVGGKIVGGVAILPPLLAYIAVNLRLEHKSMWYLHKVRALRAIRSRLQFQLSASPSIEEMAEIARARDEFDEDMRQRYNESMRLDWLSILKHGNAKHQSTEISAIPSPDLQGLESSTRKRHLNRPSTPPGNRTGA